MGKSLGDQSDHCYSLRDNGDLNQDGNGGVVTGDGIVEELGMCLSGRALSSFAGGSELKKKKKSH